MTFETGLSFWPTGPYSQIYASVLLACLFWCTIRGTQKTRVLVLAMLLGWIGARLSTSETSYLPILIGSAAGAIIAASTKTMTGYVIGGLYAAKIVWYTAAVFIGLPGYILFEISTLMGWAQIVTLMVGHNGGKGALIKGRTPHVQDGNRLPTGRVWGLCVSLVRSGRVLLSGRTPSEGEGGRRVQGGDQLVDGEDR